MILIISDTYDLQIYWVIYYLKKWGIPYFTFNVGDFPAQIKHTSIWRKDGNMEYLQLPDGQRIDCSTITAVWYRKPDLLKLPESLEDAEKEYAFSESTKDLNGLYNHLQSCYWISPIHSIRKAENKPLQLSLASSLGFSIPYTIITNDPDEAWSFYGKNDGKVVYKTLSSGLFLSRKGSWDNGIIRGEIYSTPLQAYQRSDFDLVANCPCLFQEYVKKKFEIRITVVADRIFAAEIHSQEHPATLHDWRREELDCVPHHVHELPEELSEKCLLLVKKLGLEFGAIDMIYTPDKEYVFLEINPTGQYGWIEQMTGLNISEAIAKSLVDGGRRARI
jgi:glutathione synthase/RimK-type ligase-like ATP-grasp enzyme